MASTQEAADGVVFAGESQISIRARYEVTLKKKDERYRVLADDRSQVSGYIVCKGWQHGRQGVRNRNNTCLVGLLQI